MGKGNRWSGDGRRSSNNNTFVPSQRGGWTGGGRGGGGDSAPNRNQGWYNRSDGHAGNNDGASGRPAYSDTSRASASGNNESEHDVGSRNQNGRNMSNPQGTTTIDRSAVVGRHVTEASNNSSGASAFIASSFSQHAQRRRIDFHPASRPSTVFSPSGPPSGEIAWVSGQGGSGSTGAQNDNVTIQGGAQDGIGAGHRGKNSSLEENMLSLVKIADEKIGLPPDGKVKQLS